MFLTCSGVRGDVGSTPGLEGAVCGGGVEGRSVIFRKSEIVQRAITERRAVVDQDDTEAQVCR